MSNVDRWSYLTLRVWITLSLVLMIQAHAAEKDRVVHGPKKIKNIIQDLKKQMGITEEIESIVVDKNDLIVSVQPLDGRKGVFQISFERDFLNTLDDTDLRAAIAHELGHVWIFTHHPYLHTEDLANSVAYKAVTPDAMDRVYEKVRARPNTSLTAAIH